VVAVAVKKINEIGGGGILRRTHAKRILNWMRKTIAGPDIEPAFGTDAKWGDKFKRPLSPTLGPPLECSPIYVKYILSVQQLFDIIYEIRVVVDPQELRVIKAMLEKRTYGGMTPNISLRNRRGEVERGRMRSPALIDQETASKYGPDLTEVSFRTAGWTPASGFELDNPMPNLKMWGDKS
jgi:hypothetical protein